MYHDAHGWADAPLDAEVGSEGSPAQQVRPQGEGVAVRIFGFPGRQAFRLCLRLLRRKAVGFGFPRTDAGSPAPVEAVTLRYPRQVKGRNRLWH